MVTLHGKPYFCFGVMGGDMQPQGHVQVLVNLLDFGMDVYEASAAPRDEHLWSATPTAHAARGSGTIHTQASLPEPIVRALAARGHHVTVDETIHGGCYERTLVQLPT